MKTIGNLRLVKSVIFLLPLLLSNQVLGAGSGYITLRADNSSACPKVSWDGTPAEITSNFEIKFVIDTGECAQTRCTCRLSGRWSSFKLADQWCFPAPDRRGRECSLIDIVVKGPLQVDPRCFLIAPQLNTECKNYCSSNPAPPLVASETATYCCTKKSATDFESCRQQEGLPVYRYLPTEPPEGQVYVSPSTSPSPPPVSTSPSYTVPASVPPKAFSSH